MHLPHQSRPVNRDTAVRNSRFPGVESDARREGRPATGVQPAGYEQCYALPGPAQRVCLLMATN